MKHDLNCIRTFAKVAVAGSFRKAAKALNTPLSTVSNRVARLEESLGVTLLDRSTRSVRLTDTGRSYLTSVTPALDALAGAAQHAQDRLHEPTGSLKVSAPTEFGVRYLACTIAEFNASCPRVRIDCQLTNRRVQILEEGFDIVIRAGSLEDSTLICRGVGEAQQLVTCASAEYLSEHGTPRVPSELVNHACLLMSGTREPDRWTYLVDKRSEAISLESTVSVNNFSVLLELALNHMGIVRIPRFLVARLIASRSLVQVLSEYSLSPIQFHALYPQSGRLSPKVRCFLEALNTSMAG